MTKTSAGVTDLKSMIYNHEEYSKKVMDICILRYPDKEHPCFKARALSLLFFLRSPPTAMQLYRFNLKVWAALTRFGWSQGYDIGITGGISSSFCGASGYIFIQL